LREITDSAIARPGQLRFAVVGAGAGGIEICLALEHRMRTEAGGAHFDLVAEGEILPGGNAGARRRLSGILRARGVKLRAGCAVTEVEPGGLKLSSGEHSVADHAIWVTGAAPAPWLRESGLALDSDGCVQVNRCLQSTSHAQVFAAGDVAGIAGNALPKAGVHAVRQGPTLAANLRRCLRGEPPQAFSGTRRALYLISAGERYAVMSWGAFALEGAWVWRWKDRIDRRFMRKYQQLQARLP
jgi:selenide, water dikinase